MTTTIIGYPRIGEHRELKFATQKYFKHQITAQELQEKAKALRQQHWETIQTTGIDQIPTGDFSFFDNTLDVANLLNIVPKRYLDLNLSPLDTYFAQARGYQGDAGDVKALAMKKWFNTNYHYLVPEFDRDTHIQVTDWQLFEQYQEAKDLGIAARPTLIGPYTLLKLSRFIDVAPDDFVTDLITAYSTIIQRLHTAGAEWIQLDEPALVYDQTDADLALFERLYTPILAQKNTAKILVQTYFGDLTDSFEQISELPFDGFGLDFVEGYANLDLLEKHGFPAHATLFAGIVNGKNIWRTHYADALATIKQLAAITDKLVLSTSTSLLHVPYTLRNETHLKPEEKQYLAFAEEKLNELHELDAIFHTGADHEAYQANVALFSKPRYEENKALNAKIAALTPEDYKRTPDRKTRLAIQAKEFNLPLL
ncbi:MAG TPA: 5-methyltetrahydropteroyltriglutamate--homocysteine S-methyltransferase, partial [Lactobacillus sp.]|nr:5-methyltetrahydropteroyltriglutamate--homocysteine S-methyltransferase [Lactobacillus sp.]